MPKMAIISNLNEQKMAMQNSDFSFSPPLDDLNDLLNEDLLDLPEFDERLWEEIRNNGTIFDDPMPTDASLFPDHLSTDSGCSSSSLHNLTECKIDGLTPPDTPATCNRSSPSYVEEVFSPVSSQSSLSNKRKLPSQTTQQKKFTKILPAKQIETRQPVTVLVPKTICMPLKLQSSIVGNASSIQILSNAVPVVCKRTEVSSNEIQFKNLSVEKQIAIKEARKLRNREAALNSRQKKKEYVQTIEQRLATLDKENLRLQEENGRLLKDNAKLQNELRLFKEKNEQLSAQLNLISPCARSWKGNKGTISLLAVFFIIGFNVAPFTDQLLNSKEKHTLRSSNEIPSQRTGSRTLLWANAGNDFELDQIETANSSLSENLNSTLRNATHTTFNTTLGVNILSNIRSSNVPPKYLTTVLCDKKPCAKLRRLTGKNPLRFLGGS